MRKLKEKLHLTFFILVLPVLLAVCWLTSWGAIIFGSLRKLVGKTLAWCASWFKDAAQDDLDFEPAPKEANSPAKAS